MPACLTHTNAYVPAAANVHVPAQGAGAGVVGSGVPGPGVGPAVSWQRAGCIFVKLTLCSLVPVGYVKSTVPPVAIVTLEGLNVLAVPDATTLAAGVWLWAGPPIKNAPIPAATTNGRRRLRDLTRLSGRSSSRFTA
jgi:hypothetical protein